MPDRISLHLIEFCSSKQGLHPTVQKQLKGNVGQVRVVNACERVRVALSWQKEREQFEEKFKYAAVS